MAKGATQETQKRGEDLGDFSRGMYQSAVSGGGAFGPQGLTQDYNKAQTLADKSRDAAFTGAQSLMTTGGYDPTQLASLRGNYGDFIKTGGYSPEALNFYNTTVGTGGFTPQEQTQYLNRATEGVTNTYRTLAQDAARRAAITGGYSGGAIPQMARQLSQVQAQQTNDAQAALHEQIMGNKFKAASGLGDVATARERALGGQTELETGVSRGAQTGATLMDKLYDTDTGRISEQGKMILSMMGIDTNNQALSLKALEEMAKRPGMLDNILAIANTAANVTSAGAKWK